MNEIGSMLFAFCSGDADRFAILEQVAETLDERVVACFLHALRNANEDQLVRVEILKSLPHRRDTAQDRIRFGTAVMQILGSAEDDELVRQYAAKSMRGFIECDGAIEVLENVIRNLSDNIDVRHNALGALEANVSSQRCREAPSRLQPISPMLGGTLAATNFWSPLKLASSLRGRD